MKAYLLTIAIVLLACAALPVAADVGLEASTIIERSDIVPISGTFTSNAPTDSATAPAVATTQAVALTPGRLVNLSTRFYVLSDTYPGHDAIAGFVITGGPKKVLIRQIGPALEPFGVHDYLPYPAFKMFNQDGSVFQSWKRRWDRLEYPGDPSRTEMEDIFRTVGAFALPPDSRNAASVKTLSGLYTVNASASGDMPKGVSLIEIYDVDWEEHPESRLANISTRSYVFAEPGRETIVGFVVGGDLPLRLLVRGIGPGLVPHGVTNAIVDPVLQVFDKDGRVVASNDDYQLVPAQSGPVGDIVVSRADSDCFRSVGAFQLADRALDAALVITVPPGLYTAIIRGKITPGGGYATGEALIEVYEMPEPVIQ